MHYIRMLRPPSLRMNPDGGMQTELVFTITTDLGESSLYYPDTLELVLTAHVFPRSGAPPTSCVVSTPGSLQWSPGRRVSKPKFALPDMVVAGLSSEDGVELCISPRAELSADDVQAVLAPSGGLILPVWVRLNGPDAEQDVSTRRLRLTPPSETAMYLEIEEEIGESIARHVWDAGVVALSAVVATYKFPKLAAVQNACLQRVHEILTDSQGVNVLELGCGVGILGIGLCAAHPRGVNESTILMTDLRNAEKRARSNMSLLQMQRSGSDLGYAQVMYENLDWEQGRQGHFGRLLYERRWDLVMLADCTYNVDMAPALVETLSAIHASNVAHSGDETFATRVFLATKPRHSSEEKVFELLADAGWTTLESVVLPLPMLGLDPQTVQMYLFEKA